METLQEAEEMLSIVKAAMSEYVLGKRRKSLKLGTNEFLRSYDYMMLTWDELLAEKNRLEQIITDLTVTTATPTFRSNTNFPLIVSRKF